MFSYSTKSNTNSNLPLIGVGLRHEHYDDALTSPANIDFIEVHAENFFARGGISHSLLADIKQHYAISIHATSLGLGSVEPAPSEQIEQLHQLCQQNDALLVSDHACFSWANISDTPVHSGDLLPVPFNDESLGVMSANVERAQQHLGRQILVENLSAYIELPGSTYSEAEFLTKLCQQTGCKLLVDLNNLMVNAINQKVSEPALQAQQWLDQIPSQLVGEFHLAGCTPVAETDIMIDDHSQPVSSQVWQLYRYALQKFGPVPTLVEWDLSLPTWATLVAEADKARAIAQEVLGDA